MGGQDFAARFFALLGPLLGAIVGGLISIVATQMLELRRRRHERREKLDSLRREALAGALEWVEPMRQAHTRASSLVVVALHGNVDDERLFTDWPYLLGDLVKKDLPGNQRAVLPDDVYARGHRIFASWTTSELLAFTTRRRCRPRASLWPGCVNAVPN
jgi:hypothetical protein